jgi:hypothetical protein
MRFPLPSVSALFIGLAVGTAAWAVEPYVSVPSAAGVDGTVQVKGGALVAYSNVTVRFAHEEMTPIDLVTQVTSKGTFATKFAPPLVGSYLVTVYDSNGRQIGQGRFGHFR